MDKPEPVFRQKVIASSIRSVENIAAEKLAQWLDSGIKKWHVSFRELLSNDVMHCWASEREANSRQVMFSSVILSRCKTAVDNSRRGLLM